MHFGGYFHNEQRWQRYQLSPILSIPKAAVESAQEPDITRRYKEVKFTSSKGTLMLSQIHAPLINILKLEDAIRKLQAAGRRCKMSQNKSKQCSVCKFPPVV